MLKVTSKTKVDSRPKYGLELKFLLDSDDYDLYPPKYHTKMINLQHFNSEKELLNTCRMYHTLFEFDRENLKNIPLFLCNNKLNYEIALNVKSEFVTLEDIEWILFNKFWVRPLEHGKFWYYLHDWTIYGYQNDYLINYEYVP